MTINIDLSRDSLFDSYALEILKERYMIPGESSPQDALARAAKAFATDEAHAQRLYDYCSKHWFMFATPILANAGTERGLPISCYLSYVGDSRRSILEHYTENGWLASLGGGIGTYWGALRSDGVSTSSGSKSTGSIPFMHVVDSQVLAFSQGTTRRSAYAAYQDISHPEILEFINMRRPTGGDANRKNLNLHHAVNIPDKFMEIIERCTKDKNEDDTWNLIDPHTKNVVSTISAKYLWELILATRIETGEPFIHFVDTTNKSVPEVHKRLGLNVNNSNLCTEILLPTTENRTAVCCITSLNLEYYDDWKDTSIVADLVEMLDNTLSFFIENAPESMSKAKFAASQERSIGLGTMGFHAYLQKNNVAFESEKATDINKEIYAKIQKKSVDKSEDLGAIRGKAPDFKEANSAIKGRFYINGRRNVYLMAIAPNASTSILGGNTSPGVEPYAANAYKQNTHNGMNINKNKHLDKVLRNVIQSAGYEDIRLDNSNELVGSELLALKNKRVEEKLKTTWKSIIDHKGSVQHLKLLDDETKLVYKTAEEIDQNWIIIHAADRYKYIDQGQSVNLFFKPDTEVSYLHNVHFKAWKEGLKTLYYCRSYVENRAENINLRFDKFEIKPVKSEIACLGCSD